MTTRDQVVAKLEEARSHAAKATLALAEAASFAGQIDPMTCGSLHAYHEAITILFERAEDERHLLDENLAGRRARVAGNAPTWDAEPREGESGKEWLARLIREGCPTEEWCRLADAHASTSAPESSPSAAPAARDDPAGSHGER
jgi:hypothetical protein